MFKTFPFHRVPTTHASNSPHEPLHPARFLRPFESPVQKNASGGDVYGQKPHCLEPEAVIVSLIEHCFERLYHGVRPFGPCRVYRWARTRHVKSPNQPRHNQIPWFNECRCDDRKRSCEKPDENEAGSMTRSLLLLLLWWRRRDGTLLRHFCRSCAKIQLR